MTACSLVAELDAAPARPVRCCALSDATTVAPNAASDAALARAAGYDALEIQNAKVDVYLWAGGTLGGLRAALAESHVLPLSLRATPTPSPVSGRDLVLRRRCFSALCARATALDCPMVVAEPEATRADTIRTLRALGDVAAEHRVLIGLQLDGQPDSAVRTVADAWDVLRQVAHPKLRLILDTFHFYIGGSTWAMLEALDPDVVGIVRLGDVAARPSSPSGLPFPLRLVPGDGIVPLGQLMRRVEALGCTPAYSVEMSPAAYPAVSPLARARAARASLEALLAELDELEGRLD